MVVTKALDKQLTGAMKLRWENSDLKWKHVRIQKHIEHGLKDIKEPLVTMFLIDSSG